LKKKKLNCWEFKKCGREPGGKNAVELGVCPAAMENNFEGIYGGKNAGRVCWIVAGTYCEGDVQGTFAKKIKDCIFCDFYQKVKEEEGKHFKIAISRNGVQTDK
jgi:hypothetical protein